MDSLYVIRERMQDLYSRYSIVADKAIQFVLAVMTFYMINNNVGFMKILASPVVALALAIIATFFPPIITVILATALILVHMYSVSIASLVVTALIFLIMYIFYLMCAFNVTDFHGGSGMWNGCILYDGLYEKSSLRYAGRFCERYDGTDWEICKTGLPE